MTPQYRIEQYLNAINAAYLGDTPLPEYPSEPVWRIEQFLAAILSAVKGDSPVMACPEPVWHIEEFARAIYDALTGASPAWPCPTATNNIEAILHAIYKVVADGTETDGIATSWDIERWLLDSYDAAKQGGGTALSGNLPLVLANAISHAIVSLTRYGLCTQASTPTPDAPVDIMCNNGALKMVDDELPAGYKRVLGFNCNNNAMWAITGFKLRGSDTVRISFSVTQACNVFGCYQGTDANDNYDLYVSTTSGSKYLRYGNGTYLSYWAAANLDQRFDVVFSPTGTTGMPQDSTWTEATFESANDMLIGSTTTTGTSSKLRGKLFGNIEVDGRLKLIPCERLSDNVLGYYDTYSETFFEPATGFDGATSLGYDGSHYQLEVVGTPEVLTVSGPNLLNAATNITGKYISANGGISNGNDAQYTDLIPVTAGETYVWSLVSNRAGGGTNRWHGYDSAGNWSQQIAFNASGLGLDMPFALTAVIPNGISYVRLSYGINDTEVIFRHAGSSNRISADGYYLGRHSNNGATIENRNAIQSPYTTASGWQGPAIVFSVLPRKIYVVKADAVTNYTKIVFSCYNKIEDIGNVSKALSKGDGTSFRAPNDANYAVVVYANSAVGTTFTFDEPYVSEMDADYHPYVPPQTASVPTLLSVGDVKDEAELISGIKTGRVGIKVLDGTEQFGKSSAYGAAFYIQSAANVWGAKKEIVMCSHYLGLTAASSAAAENTCFFNASGHFYFRVADNSDTAAFKADLAAKYASGNPVILLYALATETTGQITEQNLVTYEGTNIVDSVANVGPLSAEVTYKANA